MRTVSIILSGGTGSRLWPISRQALPKPFMKLGGSTLLQQTIERARSCEIDDLFIVTNKEYQFLTQDVVANLHNPPRMTSYLLEPQGRNTAPAIALSALYAARQWGENTLLLVLPADQLIPNVDAFVFSVNEALQLARNDWIVLFGIAPTSPETGFGYIEVERVSEENQRVRRFTEKPDLETAQQFLAAGNYYWNTGIFCFSAKTIISALETHAPGVLATAKAALAASHEQAGVVYFEAHSFNLQPNISIDYSVIERTDNVQVIPAKFNWSDVGSWPALANTQPADACGNTLAEDVIAIDTVGTHVHIESHLQKIVVTVGVRDLVIVDTPDALLVMHKSSAQKVKDVVEMLKTQKHELTELPAVVSRPWGTYATLKEENGYKVKRIMIKPGASLSLQYHHQREEHWIVVRGHGVAQIGEIEYGTYAGQYHHIPPKEKHRLTNLGKDELIIIEIQYGYYLGEDDIIRIIDAYGRI